MKNEPNKIIPEDIREKLWVEQAYLLYLNDHALRSGFISEKDHSKMIRKIVRYTSERVKHAKA
ncbi:MAG: hypothetical protein IKU19_03195 [Clostridia bacterium]|nr:hypothetical protein [Clostridia bacterium]